jgi:hypothetical protein
MMRLKRLLICLAAILLSATCLLGQTQTPILPLAELHPGMKGVGRTIFEGDRIDEFQVDILGVLKNALAPKRNLILGRLEGGPLATTGVISGMSGSPVYIDGKLIGAVSRAFPLSKGAIAGITPIEEMLTVAKDEPTQASRPAASIHISNFAGESADQARVLPDEDGASVPPASEAADNAGFTSIPLPLHYSGFSPAAMAQFSDQLHRLGLEPAEGGVISGSPQALPKSPTDLQPGSMISLLLIRGDLNMNIDCTVTLRDASRLYACGHQVLAQGPAQFPFAPAHVIVTVPSIASSFKIDEPGAVVGTIEQDRFDAIYGRVGAKTPAMLPIHLHLTAGENRKLDYSFDILDDPFLAPILLNLATTSALTTTERSLGASTLNMKASFHLSDGQSVDFEDVLAGDAGTVGIAGPTAAAPLALMMSSGFADLKVNSIDLNFESIDEKRTATLEAVWSSKAEVHPGDQLEVTALLQSLSGQPIPLKIPIKIPESVTDKAVQLVIGSGSSINALEFRTSPLNGTPRDSAQLVRALNRIRRNNRVYGLLMTPQHSFVMRGDEYPSPPPSLVQTFMADPGSSNMLLNGTSTIGDFETRPTSFAISGQKIITLKVVGPGI